MYKIYLYDGEYFHGERGWPLVIKGAGKYLGSQRETGALTIAKTAKGKPYFVQGGVHFSLSHSGSLWACAYGPASCGLDIQYIRKANYRRISMRHFSREEVLFVEEGGAQAFFQIWTRREALGKLTGQGFFDDMPSFVEDGRLKKTVICHGRKVYIDRLPLPEGYLGALCRYDGETFEIGEL